jgi:hypothetical protein
MLPFEHEAVTEPVYPSVESPTVELVPCVSAGIEKEQDPLVVVVAAQGFVVETQDSPDRDTDPLVQVAVAEPENPAVVLVAAPVLLCVSAPYE